MTERKPPSMSWEGFIERQIHQAEKAGEFDNLPGAGKSLPGLDQPYDEGWWLKCFLKREGVSLAPEAIAVKREIEQLMDGLDAVGGEALLRERIDGINRRIVKIHLDGGGPVTPPRPLDPEAILKTWREKRGGPSR